MAEKVTKTGLTKESGYLYYLDKEGDVSRSKMGRGEGSGKGGKIAKVGVKREKGYLYFIDKDGDVSRAKMARGQKGKKKN